MKNIWIMYKHSGKIMLYIEKRGAMSSSLFYYLFSASSMFLRGSFLASVMILNTYSVIHACE